LSVSDFELDSTFKSFSRQPKMAAFFLIFTTVNYFLDHCPETMLLIND